MFLPILNELDVFTLEPANLLTQSNVQHVYMESKPGSLLLVQNVIMFHKVLASCKRIIFSPVKKFLSTISFVLLKVDFYLHQGKLNIGGEGGLHPFDKNISERAHTFKVSSI